VVAHLQLAEAYLQNKDVPAARATLERALVLEPASDEVKAMLGKLKP